MILTTKTKVTTKMSFKIYAEGQEATKFTPGDFILTHHKTIPAKVIRIGEFLRYHGRMRDYSHWNHTALIISEDGKLIEAVGRGVSYGHISDYRDVEYYLVRTNFNKQSQRQSVEAAKSFLNNGYGWLTILSLTIQLITGIKIQFSQSNTKVCSTVVSMALWAGGVVFDSDPQNMMPADLAAAYQVRCEVHTKS